MKVIMVKVGVLKRLFQLILIMSLIVIIYLNISLIDIGNKKPSSVSRNSRGKVMEKVSESYRDSEKGVKRAELLLKWDKIRTEENVDEFINKVLDKFDVDEIDLLTLKQKDYGAYFDSGISIDLGKVVQGLGEFKEINYRLMFENDANLLKSMELAIKKESFFNRPLSEMISPNRSLPSTRPLSCENVKYEEDLPTISVIIPFFNEDFRLLVRTIHSVVNRTPPKLLKEILLVYDFASSPSIHDVQGQGGKKDKKSLKKYLKNEMTKFGKLQRYLITSFSGLSEEGKIRVLKIKSKDKRNNKRSRAGSIKAKLIGAHYAIGDVLLFLNSHCEVVSNWAEPLLARIKENPNTVVSPSIVPIDYRTLHFDPYDNEYLATGFDFDGFTKIMYSRRSNHSSNPVKSPVLMSTIFAIDRKYFWKIGSFDSGMQVVGGENLELSFRVWLCGGSIEIIPCSKIGHVFKKERPYCSQAGDAWETPDFMSINFARTSDVWLDEFKEIVMHTIDLNILEEMDVIYDASLLRRKILRKDLNCSDFNWYLNNVYPEKFAHLEESQIAGRMRHQHFPDLCLSTSLVKVRPLEVRVYECLYTENYHIQLFQIEFNGRLKLNKMFCESVLSYDEKGNYIGMGIHCDDNDDDEKTLKKNDIWTWRNDTGQIVNLSMGKCISIVENRLYKAVILEECSSEKNAQKWNYIEHVYLRVKNNITLSSS